MRAGEAPPFKRVVAWGGTDLLRAIPWAIAWAIPWAIPTWAISGVAPCRDPLAQGLPLARGFPWAEGVGGRANDATGARTAHRTRGARTPAPRRSPRSARPRGRTP